MKSVKIHVKKKQNCEDLPLPTYATIGSSGMDLYADVREELIIEPGEIRLISVGFYISIPENIFSRNF